MIRQKLADQHSPDPDINGVYPFTAPAVRPEMTYFCMDKDSRMMGKIMKTAAAIKPPQSTAA